MLLKCPRCGESEQLRRVRVQGRLYVLFRCGLAVRLPDGSDEENQARLERWEKEGGLDAWLEEAAGKSMSEAQREGAWVEPSRGIS